MNADQGIYTAVEVVIGVCCCLGNLMVILALRTSRCIHQPTFCLIVSLAVADFLVGCVAIPIAVVVDGRVETSFHTCLFISCVVLLLTLVSVLSLLAIAVDRFLRVYIPLRYKKMLSQRHTLLVVVLCWLVAIPPSFTPMFGWHKKAPQSPNSTCMFIKVIPLSYLVYFNFILCTLIPLVVMTVLYIYIFYYIRRNLREKPGSRSPKQSENYLKKEKELAGSLALVLALFALCWLPLHIMNLIQYVGTLDSVKLPLVHVGIALSHANSALNPVVYAFKIPKIRQAYLKIWKQPALCSAERQDSKTSHTVENIPSCNSNSKKDVE